MSHSEYHFKDIEARWQAYWAQNATFKANDDYTRPKYYVLDMFPYPSGAGLHVGHAEGYTASDILGRFKKAQGYNVLHPMGWDAFGLPAEQHALATGVHPAVNTQHNIDNFRRQIQSLGFGIDWDREINTTDPEYYRWTQWVFLQLFKKGLAYVDERPVWWCEALGTVLANEEIIDGKSERGNHPVERRNLRQWVLKITAYADQLLDGLEGIQWPDSTQRQQIAWIGRSQGTQVQFELPSLKQSLEVFTTAVHTLYGVTFLVIAPEHPLARALATPDQIASVERYIQESNTKSDLLRTELQKDKTGVFTGSYAVHPLTQKPIPVWIADYVLMSYGTGAVMGVPAHDERDYAFAQKYRLDIQKVLQEPNDQEPSVLVNSGPYDGLTIADATEQLIKDLSSAHKGVAHVQYKLRDWLFARQRYWGEPFPIIWVEAQHYERLQGCSWLQSQPQQPVRYVDAAGLQWYAVAVPEHALPLILPEVPSYQPSGSGDSPLARAVDWVQVAVNLETGMIAPRAQAEGLAWIPAVRETNTMPQWAGSCWYYLRYMDPRNTQQLVDPDKERYWGTPDIYIGGAEHAVLHLLYARFWHKVLYEIGVVSSPEPFRRLLHQGLILGQVEYTLYVDAANQPVSFEYVSAEGCDSRTGAKVTGQLVTEAAVMKQGDHTVLKDNPQVRIEARAHKMSKSRGNVVNLDSILAEYGADCLRLYEMFLGPIEASKPWNVQGIEGINRLLRKVWREYVTEQGTLNPKIRTSADCPELYRALHETIQKITEDTEALRFNTAISQMMIYVNQLQKAECVSLDMARCFLQLLAPYAPHIAEELWQRLGGVESIVKAPWPLADAQALVKSQMVIVLQVNGKHRGELSVPVDASKDSIVELALKHDKVIQFVGGQKILKQIYVPNKILNLVVGG